MFLNVENMRQLFPVLQCSHLKKKVRNILIEKLELSFDIFKKVMSKSDPLFRRHLFQPILRIQPGRLGRFKDPVLEQPLFRHRALEFFLSIRRHVKAQERVVERRRDVLLPGLEFAFILFGLGRHMCF